MKMRFALNDFGGDEDLAKAHASRAEGYTCALYALHAVTGASYLRIQRALLASRARKGPGYRTSLWKLIGSHTMPATKTCKVLGRWFHAHLDRPFSCGDTTAKFALQHPRGNYVIRVSVGCASHALAVCDGVVTDCDKPPHPRRRVYAAWRVLPSPEPGLEQIDVDSLLGL